MSLGDITWAEFVTAMVALYGAVLSTIILLREWKAKRPNIKVEVSEGTVPIPLGLSSDHSIFIEARNRGHKAVTLSMVGLILPDGERWPITRPLGNVRLPYELLPEKRCMVRTPAQKLASELESMGFPDKVSLIGYYDDEVGRRHKSKPTIFDTNTAKLAK